MAEAAAACGTTPDLVISCIPAAATALALREAAAAGARAALVCAGGFAEAGGEGDVHQQALSRTVRETGIRVLGPNTSGFLVPHRQLTASFVPGTADLAPGPVAVVAAGGGVNHALAFALAEAGTGLRLGVGLGVGLGNSLDVTQADVAVVGGPAENESPPGGTTLPGRAVLGGAPADPRCGRRAASEFRHSGTSSAAWGACRLPMCIQYWTRGGNGRTGCRCRTVPSSGPPVCLDRHRLSARAAVTRVRVVAKSGFMKVLDARGMDATSPMCTHYRRVSDL